MFSGFSDALKGANGGFELNRIVGFLGGLAYILCGNIIAFVTGAGLTEYCMAFPGGLAVVAGGTAVAVALKDRNVASAKVIERTGAVPAPPPARPKVPVDDPEYSR
jgi:hypothetical protein